MKHLSKNTFVLITQWEKYLALLLLLQNVIKMSYSMRFNGFRLHTVIEKVFWKRCQSSAATMEFRKSIVFFFPNHLYQLHKLFVWCLVIVLDDILLWNNTFIISKNFSVCFLDTIRVIIHLNNRYFSPIVDRLKCEVDCFSLSRSFKKGFARCFACCPCCKKSARRQQMEMTSSISSGMTASTSGLTASGIWRKVENTGKVYNWALFESNMATCLFFTKILCVIWLSC